ncbi:RdgB/HAM1 family non-canonical purine NTP pyrophosphatase [Lachnoanaerobaculum saburreum]|uniref:dITP/XTP pyrophosphatase n=1 Tax=Lachnoanaerobaculum saburreum DSM 3986 TaxID=887325 RepID=E6LJ71_9FIRM|nr:RdgB/HAM1 family non-canonical purine NTP pyrophosphatase [Lachnoanaerobaculum saburreum]EFU78005.1 non-canonical purine NTP pyrophosphatase, RdgB/HAM1 family [Lachnoanaerobaculum saburreum DSM 3986]
MKRIIFATGNQHKLEEIRAILPTFDIISAKEAGISLDIEETGTTFKENAYIKAKAIWNITGGIVLSDDSGLEVDYIGGEPGVYSSRYMGEDTSYTVKNQNIIERLHNAKGTERSARFRACICAILEDGSTIFTEGIMEGLIADYILGTSGFGYDPILYLPEYNKTSAEISPEEKNKISHRGKALIAMKQKLEENYENIDC